MRSLPGSDGARADQSDSITLGSHIYVPARDDADDESYQIKVWVTLNRATIAEIGRSLAMRRRSIARLTVLLADVDSNRKLAARIERAINRTLRECADLDELVQSAVVHGAGPNDALGQVRVHSTHGKPQSVRW